MAVRAKMVVESITENLYGGKTVRLEARYDENLPEDLRFCQATPLGHLEMMIDNPRAVEQLILGRAYYIDLTAAAE